ncbi:MAG: hypothetical protein HN348_31685, partial [Proteobacteria bacterium]|nr:hypothetical protein [Pseudomonadota bacterium]
PIIGLAAHYFTMEQSLLFQLAILVVLFGLLLVAYGRIPPKYFQVKKEVTENQ